MNESLRRRLRDAAGAQPPGRPRRPLDLDAVAARAARLDQRARVVRIAGVGVAAIALIAFVATLATRNRSTRVAVIAPPVASTTSLPFVSHGPPAPTRCPGTLKVTSSTSPDGLPAATSHTDNLAHVQDVLRTNDVRIRSEYPNVEFLGTGAGGGYVWDRTAAGSIVVRQVTNYGIYVYLKTASDCPAGAQLHRSYDGIEVIFAYSAVGPQVAPTETTGQAPTTTGPPTTSTVVPAKPGDVDGDGIADHVTITWDSGAGTATVVADLTLLGHQTIAVAATYSPAILGIVDVDRDGYGEIFLQVDQGASTAFFTIVKLVNGHLTQVTLDDQPLHLPLGGSVMHTSSFGCSNGHLAEASWDSSDMAQTYQGELDVYAFAGSQLVRQSKTTHTFGTNGQGPTNAQLSAAGYEQHCPPID